MDRAQIQNEVCPQDMEIFLAGGPGFEPRLPGPEPGVLPLNYPPSREPQRRAVTTPHWLPAPSACRGNLRRRGRGEDRVDRARQTFTPDRQTQPEHRLEPATV